MTAPASRFRILLVEDEPAIQELVVEVLQEDGVELRCAAGGAEALREARRRRPHLVLLDIVLPDLDGISVCRLLRAQRSLREVPVYMFTARVRKADREAARRAGATGYIEKPFKSQQLQALVARHRQPAPAPVRTRR
ncbi:MAG TPA: response regulator [Anaeromyxobacteraceae bacterium]|nr:response regulator [Anaeromyxobacteraceae bacterium]